MPEYLLYALEQEHIAGPPAIIKADSDAEAVEKATQLMNGHSMIEVWDLGRRVAKLSGINPGHPLISFDAKQFS